MLLHMAHPTYLLLPISLLSISFLLPISLLLPISFLLPTSLFLLPRILLPDTTQVLDIVKALADKDTLSDVVDMSSSNASRIVHDLVSRFRELRPPLHLPEELVDARQHVEGLGTLPTCDTLPSAQLYYSYIHNKVHAYVVLCMCVCVDCVCM